MKQSMAPIDFAAKLRLTAVALRCNSRKELCAQFRAVNPATHCDVDRMHKWMQGRALPRSMQVLDDLARVIGSDRSGAWLGRCSLDEYVAELAMLTRIPEEDLRRSGGTRPSPPPPVPAALPAAPVHPQRSGGIIGGLRTLAGAYACYSHAWSPHYRGRLVRGSLRLAAAAGGGMNVVYGETVAGHLVNVSGTVMSTGRVVYSVMLEPDGNLPLFLMLHMPGTPASVMTGILAGAAFLSHDSLPAASGFVAVRVDDTPRLEATNRYLDHAPAAIAADLAALGLSPPLAGQTGATIGACLRGEPQSAATADQRRLSELLDARLLR